MPTPTHQKLRIEKALKDLLRRVEALEAGHVAEAPAEPEMDWMEVLQVPPDMREGISASIANKDAMRPVFSGFMKQRHEEIHLQHPARAKEFDQALEIALKALAS